MTVLPFRFGALDSCEAGDWTLRLRSSDDDGTLRGDIVGPGEFDAYRWTYLPKHKGVTFKYARSIPDHAPHLSPLGPPGLDLAHLWALIKKHRKSA